jgi:hypothetical protein
MFYFEVDPYAPYFLHNAGRIHYGFLKHACFYIWRNPYDDDRFSNDLALLVYREFYTAFLAEAVFQIPLCPANNPPTNPVMTPHLNPFNHAFF